MKYRDRYITLLPNISAYSFLKLVPDDENFLYLKIEKRGTIISSSGKLLSKIFSLKSKRINNNNISSLKIEFFRNYLYTIINQKKINYSVYQFGFQYKEDLVPYVCSVYPCKISEDIKSFDIIIRENTNENNIIYFSNHQ